MNIIPAHRITTVLSALAESGVPYRLLRNINDELPEKLIEGKDIDLLFYWNDRNKIERFLKQNSFRKISHPLRKNKFLYGVHPFEFYKHVSADFFIDCHFELACRSLNQGEWIPLDSKIQQQAWSSCTSYPIGGIRVLGLPHACECLHLLTRCIFDKRQFTDGYIRRIEELSDMLNDAELMTVFKPVFFKFSEMLLQLLRTKRHEEIIHAHLRFKEY